MTDLRDTKSNAIRIPCTKATKRSTRWGGAIDKAARRVKKNLLRVVFLTDAVGLHLMRAWKIHTCWSTDFHLGLTGVSLVLDRS